MRFTIDESQCGIQVGQPNVHPIRQGATDPSIQQTPPRIAFDLMPFHAYFTFKVDLDKGPPGPKTAKRLQIGIVQNVLYESMSLEFQGNVKKSIPFETPILDTYSTKDAPFFHPPFGSSASRSSTAQQQIPWLLF